MTGKDLQAAVDTFLAGHAVTGPQTPSIGCNIKWRETAVIPAMAAA